MKILFYSYKSFEKFYFDHANKDHEIDYLEVPLNHNTAELAKEYDAVCIFVNDTLDKDVLKILKGVGVSYILLRCAGFNQVDLRVAKFLDIKIARVPSYSPNAVAEHATALLLSVNRRIHKAYNRVREDNFDLNGLVGFNLYQKTIGVIGAGNIGQCFMRIMQGFGANVIYFDPNVDKLSSDIKATQVDMNTLFTKSDVISLHCPLTEKTRHVINEDAFHKMKAGVCLINTGRGALIDTVSLIQALKSNKLGGVGLDVYEAEENLFFNDHSTEVIQDDVFQRLLTFPNVIITGHQGFLTQEALESIATTTLANATELENKGTCQFEVQYEGS